MTLDELADWLDAYRRAWEGLDPDAAAGLFTEDARYGWGPFDAPLEGRDAIRAAWAEATGEQQDVRFGSEPLAVTPDGRGLARWWVGFRTADGTAEVSLEGIFLVTLDDAGRCTEFREWWNERVQPLD
jgi:hypothetical protein